MDGIYGEGYTDSAALEPLFEKMLDGQDLTPDERDKLHDYLQHVYLNSETKSEIKTTADSISEDGIGDLKERLNDHGQHETEEDLLIGGYIVMYLLLNVGLAMNE